MARCGVVLPGSYAAGISGQRMGVVQRSLAFRRALSAIYENGFSVKAHLLIPAPPVDGAAGPVSPSLLAMVAGVARRSRGPSQDSTIHLSAHVGA